MSVHCTASAEQRLLRPNILEVACALLEEMLVRRKDARAGYVATQRIRIVRRIPWLPANPSGPASHVRVVCLACKLGCNTSS